MLLLKNLLLIIYESLIISHNLSQITPRYGISLQILYVSFKVMFYVQQAVLLVIPYIYLGFVTTSLIQHLFVTYVKSILESE